MLSCTSSTRPSSLPLKVVIGSSLAAVTATVMVIFLLIHGEGPDLMTRIVASSAVSLASLVTCAIAAVKMRCNKKHQALQAALRETTTSLHPTQAASSEGSHLTHRLLQATITSSSQPTKPQTTETNKDDTTSDTSSVHSFQSDTSSTETVTNNNDTKSETSSVHSFYSARSKQISSSASRSSSPAPASTDEDTTSTTLSSTASTDEDPTSTAPASTNAAPTSTDANPTAIEIDPFDSLSIDACQKSLLSTIKNIFVLLASTDNNAAAYFALSPLSKEDCLALFKTFEPMSKASLAADMLLPELKRQVETGGQIPSVSELSKAAILDLPNTKDQEGKLVLSGRFERNLLLLSMKACISFNPTHSNTVELLEKALPEKLLPKIAHKFSASLFVAVRNPKSVLYAFLTEKLTPYLTDLQAYYKANQALDNPQNPNDQAKLMKGLYTIMSTHLTALTKDLEALPQKKPSH